ncbi:MAG: hypothetical protein LRY41_02095, partial [Candidatus Pacebacteria bacterium]|nr:hypothetical protein [Candidatus Paceibacterota bacterium]
LVLPYPHMFKKLRDKAMMALLKRQLTKQGIPEAQIDMILEKIQSNPAILDLFKKAEEKMKEKQAQGMNETAAAMQVQREMQAEFQKALMQ